ncbi:MAG TPA: cytochrome c [Vicinamibacterales bacterium]
MCLATVGCNQKMADGPRYKPLAASDFFPDGQSARPRVRGTIFHGEPERGGMAEGRGPDGELAMAFPVPVTRDLLARGQERFDIFCAPCHGRLGNGDGMVVQRGFKAPPSYNTDRLRQVPVGHFVDVIANGFGAMSSYSTRVPPSDRWAITAYIRALQRSQHTTIADVPADERQRLQETP